MKAVIGTIALVLTGCTTVGGSSQDQGYSDPAQSGLLALRPYPTARDVCQVIGENAQVTDYLDHTAVLVGCPKTEQGAIADRRAEGGVIVGDAQDWVLISIPQE